MRPRAFFRLAPVALACALLPTAPVKGEPAALPNLVPVFQSTLPEIFEGEYQEFEAPSRRGLHFDTYLLNAGPAPLEVRGVFDPAGVTEDPKAEQCIGFDEAGLCATYEGTGGLLHWYTPHYLLDEEEEIIVTEECYAVEAIVAYELRRLVNGVPDFSPEGLGVSHLVGHSLQDERQHGDYPPAGPPTYTYTACLGAGLLRQGLSPGAMEARAYDERGQFVDLANRNGAYALVIRADPLNRIRESDEEDNLAIRRLEIFGTKVKDLDG